MSRFAELVIALVTCLVVVVPVSSLVSCNREGKTRPQPILVDRFAELVFPLFVDHDTEYSPGYNEAVFRELEPGLSQQEVRKLLGPPLSERQFSENQTFWYYSRAGKKSDNYYTRIVEFDRAGRMVAKHRTFYLD